MKTLMMIIFAVLFSANMFAQQNTQTIQKAFEESYKLEKESKYTDAIAKMKSVYSESSYEVNLRLGWLNYLKGSFDASEKFYSKAVELLPYSEEAKFGLIMPKAATGKWSEVEKLYKDILSISPNNTTANYRLGLIYYNQKKFAEAYPYFEKVANLYPFSYDGLLMYAWTSLQMGKMKDAKIIFNKVLMLSPGDSSAKEGLGYIK